MGSPYSFALAGDPLGSPYSFALAGDPMGSPYSFALAGDPMGSPYSFALVGDPLGSPYGKWYDRHYSARRRFAARAADARREGETSLASTNCRLCDGGQGRARRQKNSTRTGQNLHLRAGGVESSLTHIFEFR